MVIVYFSTKFHLICLGILCLFVCFKGVFPSCSIFITDPLKLSDDVYQVIMLYNFKYLTILFLIIPHKAGGRCQVTLTSVLSLPLHLLILFPGELRFSCLPGPLTSPPCPAPGMCYLHRPFSSEPRSAVSEGCPDVHTWHGKSSYKILVSMT